MAKQRKKSIKTKAKKPVRRKKPIKLNTARRRIDPRTGIELSRRQFEKKYPRKKRVYKKSSAQKFAHKIRLYKLIRDDFIEAQKKKGKILNKRQAMNSASLKKIIRGLHSKNPLTKAKALAQTGRITADQIELYAQKFGGNEGGEE